MDFLYVIKKINEANIIDCCKLQILEETETEYILLDHINIEGYVRNFPKDMLDKEYPLFFVTKNKRKLKKQVKRIYENISKLNEEKRVGYEHELNKVISIQRTNETNYNDILNHI